MKKYVVAILVVVTFSRLAVAQEVPLPLTLQEAIKVAAEKNLDVQAELYNTAAYEADIRRYGGIYDMILSALLNYQESRSVSASPSVFGGSTLEQKILRYNAGASQLLPTGGTFDASFNNSWVRNNYALIDNYYESAVTLNFTQPLFRNFGREVTELNISVSRFNKEASFEQFKTRLLNTVSQVTAAYFQLISLRQDLEIKKTSLGLAQKILNDTNARVKAGVLPAMEILNAEFGVATREKDVIDADRAVKDQSDALRLLLQLPQGGDIIPVDRLSSDAFAVDEAAEIRRALASRPDLRQLQTALQSSELQSRVARKQTLPDVLFTASVAPTGFGEQYGRDLERLGSIRYPVWGVGLQFSYPLGNHAAENEYIKSKLRVNQGKTQIKSLQETIANDVRTAARSVESSYKQLDVTRRGRAYAEERLNAFIKKNAVGLATTKDVLDVENDLVSAKGNEIKALAAYNNAISQLWRITGELLDRQGVKVSVNQADTLYERNK